MKPTEPADHADKLLATTNKLLVAIIVLLVIMLVLNALNYFNMLDLSDYVIRGFNAVYDRMGHMRVY